MPWGSSIWATLSCTKVWHQAGQHTDLAHTHTHTHTCVQKTTLRHARHITSVSGLLPVPLLPVPLLPISVHVAKPKWEQQTWSVWVLQQQVYHLFCAGTAMSQHPKNPATTGKLKIYRSSTPLHGLECNFGTTHAAGAHKPEQLRATSHVADSF